MFCLFILLLVIFFVEHDFIEVKFLDISIFYGLKVIQLNFSRRFVLGVTFRCIIHFDFIFILRCKVCVEIHFFGYGHPVVQVLFDKKIEELFLISNFWILMYPVQCVLSNSIFTSHVAAAAITYPWGNRKDSLGYLASYRTTSCWNYNLDPILSPCERHLEFGALSLSQGLNMAVT